MVSVTNQINCTICDMHMHSFPRPIPNTLLVGDVRLKYGVSQPHPSHI